MSRAAKIKAMWYAIKADGKRPSRRRIQEALKLFYGTKLYSTEVEHWLRDNQIIGEGGQPYLRPNLDSATFSIEEKNSARARVKVASLGLGPVQGQLRANSGPSENGKPNNHAAKNGTLGPSQGHLSDLMYGSKEEDININGVVPTPSSRVGAPAISQTNGETKTTSTEDEKPAAAPVPLFESGDEARVQRLLGAMAAEAEGGIVDEAALRAEMRQVLGTVGTERWRYGMEIALIAEGAGTGNRWRYAQGVIRRHDSGRPSPSRQNGKPRGDSITPERKAEIDEFAAELEAEGQREYEMLQEARRMAQDTR